MTSTAESTPRMVPSATTTVEETARPKRSPSEITDTIATSVPENVQYHCNPVMSKKLPVDKSEIAVVKTSWFKATTPIVGMSKATNSSFLDELLPEIREEIPALLLFVNTEFTSRVAAINAMTATSRPARIPQRSAPRPNTRRKVLNQKIDET